MRIRVLFLSAFLTAILSSFSMAQYEFEWELDNTSTNTGERIVAVIDAGTIGTFDGIGIIGEIYDDNGNWGYSLPERSDFRMFLKFSQGEDYEIVQDRQTSNITLRLRKVSSSVYHLTAFCEVNHRSVSVKFERVVSSGIASFTLGHPDSLNSSGQLVISEPTYSSNFDGKVGIGTSNPDEALTVKGKIHAEEVIVNLNVPGPDYVFEEDYDLPTLAEIEAFITANKHLPEVPSAAEMEQEGIVLGDMNMLLLKKIEELTLYAIALEKTVNQGQETEEELTRKLGEQQKTNNDQQGTINELIKRIEALETAINEQ